MWISILIFVVALIAVVSRLPALQIRTVSVAGTKTVPAGDVKALVEEELRGTYVVAFPRRNTLIYPRDSIRVRILSEWPRISTLDITHEGLGGILLHIEERSPAGLWCGGEAEFESASMSGCYFLDATGFVFAQAGMFSGGVFHKYYGDLGTRSPVGSRYVREEYFASYREFLSSLGRLGYEGERSLVQPNGNIILVTSSHEKFFLSGTKSFDSALSYLSAVVQSGEIRGKEIEYFDLRFGNRVYYKLRQE